MHFWDARSAQWLYRNATEAVIVDGKLTRFDRGIGGDVEERGQGVMLVHWLCFEAADGQEAAAMLLRHGARNGSA